MLTQTSLLKSKLEHDANISFVKLDTLRWASYIGDVNDSNEIVRGRTLGQCVWDTAKEIGE